VVQGAGEQQFGLLLAPLPAARPFDQHRQLLR
jgi:hypothetical protein